MFCRELVQRRSIRRPVPRCAGRSSREAAGLGFARQRHALLSAFADIKPSPRNIRRKRIMEPAGRAGHADPALPSSGAVTAGSAVFRRCRRVDHPVRPERFAWVGRVPARRAGCLSFPQRPATRPRFLQIQQGMRHAVVRMLSLDQVLTSASPADGKEPWWRYPGQSDVAAIAGSPQQIKDPAMRICSIHPGYLTCRYTAGGRAGLLLGDRGRPGCICQPYVGAGKRTNSSLGDSMRWHSTIPSAHFPRFRP